MYYMNVDDLIEKHKCRKMSLVTCYNRTDNTTISYDVDCRLTVSCSVN